MTLTIKLKKNEELFYLAYGMYLIISILQTSFYARYIVSWYKFAVIFCMALVCLQELRTSKYSKKTLGIFFVSVLIAMLMYLNGSIPFMAIFVFVYCGRNIQFRRLASFTNFVSVITVMFVVLSALLGLIENYVGTHIGHRRMYFGFLYGLFLPCYVFNFTALSIYIRGSKIKLNQLFLLLLLNTILFFFSDARLSYYLALLLILIAYVLKVSPYFFVKKRVICFLMASSFVICAGISIYCTVFYNDSVKWLKTFNDLIGGRLSLGNMSLLKYGVSLWGQEDIKWVGSGLDIYGNAARGSYLFVDNLYIQLMQQYGIVVFLIYILLHTMAAFRCWKNQDYYSLSILTVLAGRAVVDNLSVQLYYNTFWFVIGSVLILDGRARIQRFRSADRELKCATNI